MDPLIESRACQAPGKDCIYERMCVVKMYDQGMVVVLLFVANTINFEYS